MRQTDVISNFHKHISSSKYLCQNIYQLNLFPFLLSFLSRTKIFCSEQKIKN